MKTIIFSDTHLTNVFDTAKYLYLTTVIKQADRVIINGDFWDGYLCTFDQLVESDWRQMFPLLKKKHTVYIYGNHDKQKWCDKRVSLFSSQSTTRYTFRIKEREFIVEHGYEIAPSLELRFPYLFANSFIMRLNDVRQELMYRYAPQLIYIIDEKDNRKIKQWCKSHLHKNQYLITGHTHLQEFDKHAHYINTGVNKFGIGQYVLIEDESIRLINERY